MFQDSHDIGRRQERYRDDERMQALRALLMTPLMTPACENFAAVRRHADELRAWFARETGWSLHIERDCARLYKRPADLGDATRGLPGYDRRRYVLLCLACAVLERADPQITLRLLGERLLLLAADPALAAQGFRFALTAIHERRELIAVCPVCWNGACCSAWRATKKHMRTAARRKAATRCTTYTGACWPASWPLRAARPPGRPDRRRRTSTIVSAPW
jgi:hypothetical protein